MHSLSKNITIVIPVVSVVVSGSTVVSVVQTPHVFWHFLCIQFLWHFPFSLYVSHLLVLVISLHSASEFLNEI